MTRRQALHFIPVPVSLQPASGPRGPVPRVNGPCGSCMAGACWSRARRGRLLHRLELERLAGVERRVEALHWRALGSLKGGSIWVGLYLPSGKAVRGWLLACRSVCMGECGGVCSPGLLLW